MDSRSITPPPQYPLAPHLIERADIVEAHFGDEAPEYIWKFLRDLDKLDDRIRQDEERKAAKRGLCCEHCNFILDEMGTMVTILRKIHESVQRLEKIHDSKEHINSSTWEDLFFSPISKKKPKLENDTNDNSEECS